MNPDRRTGELPDELVEDEVLGDIVEPLVTRLDVGQVDVCGLTGAVL